MPETIDHRARAERIELAHATIRETVDNDRRGEWCAIGAVAFAWDGSNRFRVRATDDAGSGGAYVFGSSNVVACISRETIGPAIVQTVKLERAAEIRALDRARCGRRAQRG